MEEDVEIFYEQYNYLFGVCFKLHMTHVVDQPAISSVPLDKFLHVHVTINILL